MREDGVSITKADLRAAVDALDDWFDANAATLNTALPVAARNGLTTTQKARLLRAVIARRYLSGV
jgi:Ni2+-binding GTPase involved in maturation of urease and hydrogenase